MTIEAIVRPFETPVTGRAFHEQGESGSPPVRITVGLRGGTKTFAYSGSYTANTYMVAVHRENAVQGQLGN